jgi:hypothetical protein
MAPLALFASILACLDAHSELVGEPLSVAEATRMIGWARYETKVDILLVVDDSPSMAQVQRPLANSLPGLIDLLEAPDVTADYRIAVVDAYARHPACADRDDEGGAASIASCRARADEFPGDLFADACLCTFDAIATTPTTTDEDPVERSRPWIESRAGRSNLAIVEGRVPTTHEALQCIVPQGVAGCDFPSPLEAMYRALLRMHDVDDPQYGFLRDDATLLVVIVTNGNDCSVDPQHASTFLHADGSPPTRAACWHAGVECTGGPGVYYECHASSAQDAVLHPLERYLDVLRSLAADKAAIDPDRRVMVELVGGVPPGFDNGQSTIVYADAIDLEEQREFGIGAGCTNSSTAPPLLARPPVRELELAEATRTGERHHAFSICEDDYSPAFIDLARPIVDVLRPACMPVCVADADLDTPELEPTCHVDQEIPRRGRETERRNVPACLTDETLPLDEDVCFVALVDDELSSECDDNGWNLEFRIVRREGVPAPFATTLSATCLVSQRPQLECPSLP